MLNIMLNIGMNRSSFTGQCNFNMYNISGIICLNLIIVNNILVSLSFSSPFKIALTLTATLKLRRKRWFRRSCYKSSWNGPVDLNEVKL